MREITRAAWEALPFGGILAGVKNGAGSDCWVDAHVIRRLFATFADADAFCGVAYRGSGLWCDVRKHRSRF